MMQMLHQTIFKSSGYVAVGYSWLKVLEGLL
ncbi:MAG: hypothetical protein CM1200mP5_3390 [Candidatus Pelagibacterales bacterium]|nr:MAG: hypothetical protein CM1200mP5_3390 [Pelagibacterales bacterium]